MRETIINSNGDFPLLGGNLQTTDKTTTVHGPDNLNGATAVISYQKQNGTVLPYLDGALIAGDQKLVRCGRDVTLMLTVTGFASNFTVEVGR